jgi:atypical dual specificity phosphatase
MRAARTILRLAISTTYYPSLWVSRALCAVGNWNWWDEVDETIILGAVPSQRDLVTLHGLGVRSVVNMCAEFSGHMESMKRLGMSQLHLPTLDYFPPSETDLRRGVDFIREIAARKERAYLHCKAGRGRSATLAIAYFMTTRGMSLVQAFEFVKRARKQIDGHLVRRRILLSWRWSVSPLQG